MLKQEHKIFVLYNWTPPRTLIEEKSQEHGLTWFDALDKVVYLTQIPPRIKKDRFSMGVK